MNLEEYKVLLKRAKSSMNTNVNVENVERFVLPPVDMFIEGRNTVIKNFRDISDKMRRPVKDLAGYIQKDFGASISIEDKRLTIKTRLYRQQIEEKINNYLEIYVICHECKKPDTHIEKDGKIHILVCEACGARRSLNAAKKTSRTDQDVIEVGKTYPVTISTIDKNGYGIAKYGMYTIFVAGKIKKNGSYNVKIEKVLVKDAFGHTIS
ncbi:MAG: translation initiation factor IF-2 subunit beta [Candidatus Thermoplasmatota archaeon]|jgi:translation initiation factor 2 subunit 2|nr:translation initiation factor IF-2 subunit beta [Candidatus Thermoplasmatota archaeon]MCL5963594.1 translation initiation factor IF-2 subunit beta [Candidatus Thermoplasmatota archaeon]